MIDKTLIAARQHHLTGAGLRYSRRPLGSTQKLIIGVLTLDWMTVEEIAALVCIARIKVKNSLGSLWAAGIVDSERRGNDVVWHLSKRTGA